MEEKDIKQLVQDMLDSKEEGQEKADDSKVEAKSADELADAIGDKIAKSIADTLNLGKDAEDEVKSELFSADKGFGAIKGYPTFKQLEESTDDEKIVYFFKSLLMKDKDEEANKVFKALTEGTPADGGYLVPAPLATEIWRILPNMSIMRRLARVVPMTSKTLGLNSLTGRPKAYWTSEYASKTTSSADFAQATLTAHKLVCLLPATHELIADANIDMVRYIIEVFAEAIAEAEDTAFFSGSGTGRPKGINQETLANSASAGATLDFDDIIDLMHLVPQAVRASSGTAFVGNQAVIKQLQKVKDDNNDYIWRMGTGITNGQTSRLPDTVYGYPIYEQNDLADTELYFGDWKYYIIGDRQQITVETTNVGGDAWRRDSTEVKAVERVGGTTVMTSAFAKLTSI